MDAKTQGSGVDVAVAPDEDGTPDRLGKDVEHTVEDGFGVRVDDVAALGQTPCNGVQKPEEHEHGAGDVVGALDVGVDGAGVLATWTDDNVNDVEEGDHADGPVALCQVSAVLHHIFG